MLHANIPQRSPRESREGALYIPKLGLGGYHSRIEAHGLDYRVVQVSLGGFTVDKQIHASHLMLLLLQYPYLPDQTLDRGNDAGGFPAVGKKDIWRHPQLEPQLQDGVSSSTLLRHFVSPMC